MSRLATSQLSVQLAPPGHPARNATVPITCQLWRHGAQPHEGGSAIPDSPALRDLAGLQPAARYASQATLPGGGLVHQRWSAMRHPAEHYRFSLCREFVNGNLEGREGAAIKNDAEFDHLRPAD